MPWNSRLLLADMAHRLLSSISLPNSAPSRNSGKNCARKLAALSMKLWVQWASKGSRENIAAIKAASGERREQQHAPASEGERDQQAEPDQDAEKP